MAGKPTPAADQDKFILRLPDGMRERLKAYAAGQGRSLNAEIVHRLEQSLDHVGFYETHAALELARQHDRLAAILWKKRKRIVDQFNDLLGRDFGEAALNDFVKRMLEQAVSETDGIEAAMREEGSDISMAVLAERLKSLEDKLTERFALDKSED